MSRSMPGDPGGYGQELAEYVRDALPGDIAVDDVEAPANAWDCLVVALRLPDERTERVFISPPRLSPSEVGWWFAGREWGISRRAVSRHRIEQWVSEDLPALQAG